MTTHQTPLRAERPGIAPVLPDTLLEVRRRELEARRLHRRNALGTERLHQLRVRATGFVSGGDLGNPAVADAQTLHRALTLMVNTEIASGATVHRRVPRLLRMLPWAVALLDGVILYAFLADIFNVPSGDLGPNGQAALALAVLGSAITYTWLSVTGTRLRDHRSRLGAVEWRLTDAFTRFLVVVAAVLATSLGVLMYHRVTDKAALAGDLYIPADQIVVLGCVFAILSVSANLSVVTVHALDGSAMAADLRRVGAALHRHELHLRQARWAAVRDGLPDAQAHGEDDAAA